MPRTAGSKNKPKYITTTISELLKHFHADTPIQVHVKYGELCNLKVIKQDISERETVTAGAVAATIQSKPKEKIPVIAIDYSKSK